MLNFLFGVLVAVVIYTFFPVLALQASQWLRRAIDWLKFRV